MRDSGVGIAPENQNRIFEGFSQAEASTTRRFGGSGLGVAISQRLIQLMGGHLSVVSAVGLQVLLVDDNPIALAVPWAGK